MNLLLSSVMFYQRKNYYRIFNQLIYSIIIDSRNTDLSTYILHVYLECRGTSNLRYCCQISVKKNQERLSEELKSKLFQTDRKLEFILQMQGNQKIRVAVPQKHLSMKHSIF
jgi:hypothetical protein